MGALPRCLCMALPGVRAWSSSLCKLKAHLLHLSGTHVSQMNAQISCMSATQNKARLPRMDLSELPFKSVHPLTSAITFMLRSPQLRSAFLGISISSCHRTFAWLLQPVQYHFFKTVLSFLPKLLILSDRPDFRLSPFCQFLRLSLTFNSVWPWTQGPPASASMCWNGWHEISYSQCHIFRADFTNALFWPVVGPFWKVSWCFF